MEFSGEKITELTANNIPDSVYTHCDVDSNGYLLLDSIINYKGDGKPVTLADQEIRV